MDTEPLKRSVKGLENASDLQHSSPIDAASAETYCLALNQSATDQKEQQCAFDDVPLQQKM